MLFISTELQAGKDRAEEYISRLTEHNAGIIQLYHTKRAAKEIVQSKMHLIRSMYHEGVLDEDVG